MNMYDSYRQNGIFVLPGLVLCSVLLSFGSELRADEPVANAETIKTSDDIIDEMMGTRGFGVQAKAILDVKFEYDSAVLTEQARQQLEQLAGALQSRELKHFKYELVGHTSSEGSTEHNQALSEARAKSAFMYLTRSASIQSARLSEVGYGESAPLDTSNTESPTNRRVEVVEVGEYQP